MNLLSRRLDKRNLPLDARFQRGIRVGFIVTATIAISLLVLTELTSGSLARHVEAQSDLAEQRAEVAKLGSLISLLAGAEGPADAAQRRVEIGVAVESVRERQIALQLQHPELLETLVDVGDSILRFDRAFDRTMAEIDTTVELLADEALFASFRTAAGNETVSMIGALGPTYADLAATQIEAGLFTVGLIRSVGRILGLVSLLAGGLRLFVLGRPLVDQLQRDQVEHEETLDAQRDTQMRAIVSQRMAEGLEAVDDEAGVRNVVERSLGRMIPGHSSELLLADSSMAHLSVRAQNPHMPAPGCGVQSPWSCPAVRRASTQIFDDSEGIRACPYLANRPGGACSAMCIPVAFVGESMGVLHVTGEPGWVPGSFERHALESLASQTAVRLGAIRSFEKAEIQASTDVLTGLPNRRAVEDQLSRFLASRTRGAVAMADLDHFKLLNDNYGHEAGDRALRMFAEVLRTALRENDVAGRWGGEEFVVLLPDLSAREGAVVLDRIRTELAAACLRSDGPDVTVSIGVVDTTAGSSVDALVALADECLYAAKGEGRDRIIVGPVKVESNTSRQKDEEEVSA